MNRRSPVLCSLSCDGAINLPAPLGHLQNISLAHQACSTHSSELLREPGLYLAVVGQLLLGYPSAPLACTALECHRMYSHQGAITLELRSQNQPTVGWHKGGTGIQTQKWVYPFTCITSATERLYPVPYTIQSRWWLARTQGLL